MYGGRPLAAGGVRDVDEVVTTRDLGALLRRAGIQPGDLQDNEFDSPLGKVVQVDSIRPVLKAPMVFSA